MYHFSLQILVASYGKSGRPVYQRNVAYFNVLAISLHFSEFTVMICFGGPLFLSNVAKMGNLKLPGLDHPRFPQSADVGRLALQSLRLLVEDDIDFAARCEHYLARVGSIGTGFHNSD